MKAARINPSSNFQRASLKIPSITENSKNDEVCFISVYKMSQQ